MAQIKYVDYDGLSYYDSKLKAFLATADVEVLARANVTIEEAETPTEGSAITYVVYQNYEEEGNPEEKTKIEISKIEIPLDKVVDGGKLAITEATDTDPVKAEIVLTIANTFDETTESKKKEIRVDISAVAGDIAEVVARVDALESAVGFEGEGEDKHLVAVAARIKAEAKGANYTVDETGEQTESIGEALARFEGDLTYKGTVAVLPIDAKKGDLYNVVPNNYDGPTLYAWADEYGNYPVAFSTVENPTESDIVVDAEGNEYSIAYASSERIGVKFSGSPINCYRKPELDKIHGEVIEDAPKGWKFWDGTEWQNLSDASLADRVEALEALHVKNDDDEFQTVLEEVIANAKDGIYKEDEIHTLEVNTGTGTTVLYKISAEDAKSIADGQWTDGLAVNLETNEICHFHYDDEEDFGKMYSGETGDIKVGDFYSSSVGTKPNVVTIEQAIKALEDATLDVNEYYGDTLAGDVINRLTSSVETEGSILERIYATAAAAEYTKDAETSEIETIGAALKRIDGDVETDGSILKKIYDTAANGFYDEILVPDEEGRKPGEEGYVETKADRTIREKIEAVAGAAEIDVIRLDSPTASYAASYMITQNGEQVGELIDIPKDFLVKSAKLVHYVEDEDGKVYEIVSDPGMTNPVEKPEQCDLNKDYMDFTINTKDELPTEESHLYIDVTHLCEVYTGKEVENGISVKISAANEISAEVSGKAVDRKNITEEFEADLAAIEDAIGYVDPEAELKELFKVAERINKEAKDGIYKEGEGATVDTTAMQSYDNTFPSEILLDAEQYAAYKEGYVRIAPVTTSTGYNYEVMFDNGNWNLYNYISGDYETGYPSADVPVTPNKDTTIAEAIKALEDASSDTNGALVLKGEVENAAALPTDAKKGDAYQVADEKALYIKTDDAWARIANEGVFTLGNGELNKVVDIKTYIDSRIFIGTQEEVDTAKLAGIIDDSTFVVVTDEEADTLIAITEDEIDSLFNPVIVTP